MNVPTHRKDMSLAQRLCFIYYIVKIPEAFVDDPITQLVGRRKTGNSKRDAELSKHMRPRQLTIAEMTKLYSEGCRPMDFHRPNDVVQAYEDVVDYLADLRTQFESPFHKPSVPTEYIENLDLFAAFLFEGVRRIDPKYQYRGNAAPVLGKFMARRANKHKRYMDALQKSIRDAEGNRVVPQHQPITGSILEALENK
jgi:hypothetical protein